MAIADAFERDTSLVRKSSHGDVWQIDSTGGTGPKSRLIANKNI
jgi:hypothetical protein